MLAMLDRMRRGIRATLPGAESFRRPGFDGETEGDEDGGGSDSVPDAGLEGFAEDQFQVLAGEVSGPALGQFVELRQATARDCEFLGARPSLDLPFPSGRRRTKGMGESVARQPCAVDMCSATPINLGGRAGNRDFQGCLLESRKPFDSIASLSRSGRFGKLSVNIRLGMLPLASPWLAMSEACASMPSRMAPRS